ncbi:crotonase/enoyl-CoA hydratase family protein [Hoyosella sp. YIM 151337]|uniref:crotonase/enoyl-CoA hydratase family protein n=1 Tax=Hoyosella sp. YIM 151337 TaxID=2992742 RepID=UPI0022363EE2|nr:crotonase/enoyl-CoA hydratase family protein [Hoyosella sp. YIM 151337]MCW4355557.1 crotonase/enoyl-CoA hydratase family protein [Hoyosella sp. YIM 151337]
MNLGTLLTLAASVRRNMAVAVGAAPDVARAAVASFRITSKQETAHVPVALSGEYAHTYTESASIAAALDDVLTLMFDFSRYPEWFSVHAGWPDGPPASPATGDRFTQNARVMGTPVRVTWIVTARTRNGMVLEGSGPLGTRAGLAFSAVERAGSTDLGVVGGFESDALKGPMGAMVARALHAATAESLQRLAALVAGATPAAAESAPDRDDAPPRPKPGPVPHPVTGELLDPWAPVIVGVGQSVHHPTASGTVDPITLAAQAVTAAIRDMDAALPASGALGLFAVPTTSWAYGDTQAAILADVLGVEPVELTQSAPLGGDGPLRLLNDAAARIAAGRLDVAVLAGAEAFASLATLDGAPDWERVPRQKARPRAVGSDKPGTNAAEEAVGLLTPPVMYALMETAMRGRLARDPGDHVTAISQLWSRFAAAAKDNPYAWVRKGYTAPEIAQPSDTNRPIAAPYTKLMSANLTVDQGAAVVLCSAAAAVEAGITPEKWVFLHAGAHADEEWYVSERHDLAAVPAIGAVGDALLTHAGVTVNDIEHVDLYSCFPFAVQAAALELGLPLDDPARPLTCTGGLTFAGGPLNNYSTHGVAALVQSLRAAPGSMGLVTALGWFATKHAGTVLSTAPPQRPFRDIDAGIRLHRTPSRTVTTEYVGPCVVESYTMPFTASGQPEAVILSLLTADGTRFLHRSVAPGVLAAARERDLLGVSAEVRGADITLAPGGPDAARVRTLIAHTQRAPRLHIEWEGPLCVITLNRPEVRNAIDLTMALDIERALDAFDADPEARVAVLTGSGGEFCTGMDLKAAARGEFPVAPQRGLLGMTRKPPAKPIIAAVEGHALAGGFELALACDLIVAARDAVFGLPEPRRGLVAAAGGVLRLARQLPRPMALEIALTGNPVPASRLYELGLINFLSEPGEALSRASELAAAIAANAPLSVAVSKQIVDATPDWPVADAFDRQSELASPVTFTDDAAEGIRAFEEKRAPQWRGR